MTALIDADVIVYRAIAPATSEVDWDGEGVTPLHNLPTAKKIAHDLVESWRKLSGEKQVRLIFSDRTQEDASFRYKINPHYKGNRTGPKPPMHDEIHDYLTEQYPSTFLKDFEGDDLMGLMATEDPKYVMVTIDKDMKTLPGRLVNPMDKDPKVRKISLRQANYEWMYQTIVGDTVDNFKGAPGAGPKKAEEVLDPSMNFGQLVTAARRVFEEQASIPRWAQKFVNRGDDLRDDGSPMVIEPFDEFLMNARCARILRTGDYDAEYHRVKLWHPTHSTWMNPHYERPADAERAE